MSEERIIQISKKTSGTTWEPVQGRSFTNLINENSALSETEKDTLTEETFDILRSCSDPGTPAVHNTGLIIGYVQSGKTLSFTSLAALARDNKFQIVVLLAGTTNNLVEQSFERIKQDLKTNKNREWKLFSTQQGGFQQEEVDRVASELAKWERGNPRAKTILIVSMKQHQHLQNLAQLLSDVDLTSVPTLIIDDEGDQAGMNTKALQEEESTTYTRINELRRVFPHHSYLLYTATPQAPLLISRIDTLSPDFGKVLTPGESYVGGQEFFVEGRNDYVELIPYADVPDRSDPPSRPPASLLSAMRDFFIGVAIGLLEGEDQKGANRSMMIHPAVPRDMHLLFVRWARNLKEEWSRILGDANHPERPNQLSEFRKSFNKLRATYPTEFTFRDVEETLFEAIQDTALLELNTRARSRIPSVDWNSEYSWILIGGVGLDRGFTVEGLTVSYMPRSIGVGNADNIQQRGRFFGYKKGYLGLCRIYLTGENIDAFESYVSHEESIRGSIRRHLDNGETLKDWRRTYFLDSRLNPTRSSVVLLEMYQSKGRGGWIYPDFPYQGSEIIADNRLVIDNLLAAFDFQEYTEQGWNTKQIVPSFSSSITLGQIIPYIGQLGYKIPEDNLQHSALVLGLDRLANDFPKMCCDIYALSGPWSGIDAVRTLSSANPPKIKNLFQGPNARTNYPGARALASQDKVTFQIHRYDIRTSDKSRVLKDVPVLAVHVPDHLAERVWIEH